MSLKTQNGGGPSRQGFTLVEIMIVILLVGFLATLALPGFMRVREDTRRKICINNQRLVEAALDLYSMSSDLDDGDPVARGPLLPYLKSRLWPVCPSTNTEFASPVYVGRPVTCPTAIASHHR